MNTKKSAFFKSEIPKFQFYILEEPRNNHKYVDYIQINKPLEQVMIYNYNLINPNFFYI